MNEGGFKNMTKLALVTLLLLPLGILHASEADKPVKVFILAGQSNMEGQAEKGFLVMATLRQTSAGDTTGGSEGREFPSSIALRSIPPSASSPPASAPPTPLSPHPPWAAF